MLSSILIGISLPLINTIASLIVALRAYKRNDMSDFSRIIMLSLVIRYFIATFLIWFCLVILDLDKLYFGLTFIISTFIFIILEILYINFRSNFLILKIRNE